MFLIDSPLSLASAIPSNKAYAKFSLALFRVYAILEVSAAAIDWFVTSFFCLVAKTNFSSYSLNSLSSLRLGYTTLIIFSSMG